MPLNYGAQPGSKKFQQNIKTEVNEGNRPVKQAVAIAYSVAKRHSPKKHPRG